MVHLYLAWKYIPGYEGIFTGIVNAGFGCGGCLSNYLAAVLVNPENVDPIKDPKLKPFSHEVADRVPYMLRTLSYMYMCIFVVTLLTIQGFPPYDELEQDKQELEEKVEKYQKFE